MKKALFTLAAVLLCAVAAYGADAMSKTALVPANAIQYSARPIALNTNDGVFACEQNPSDGLITIRYVWPNPAVIYSASIAPGKDYRPGRQIAILKIKSTYTKDSRGMDIPARSKPELKLGITATIKSIGENFYVGGHLEPGDVICTMLPSVVTHDSVTPSDAKGISFSDMMHGLWNATGICELIRLTKCDWTLGLGRVIMIFIGLVLLYLAIVKGFEPLLLLPIGFGAVMSNIPLANMAGPDGFLGIMFEGINLGIYPLIIFLGVGAMTDFGPLIANPIMSLLGGAAQLGIFGALLLAVLLSHFCPFINFSLKDAASIGIIGGADGPTSIFLASRLSPNLLGSIAVAAYSYMALVPIIFPPVIKALTTRRERLIRMSQMRKVSKMEKVIFPLVITLMCAFLLPDAAPLISMLMLGNLLKECMCTDRLSDTASNSLINIITLFLGLTVGSKLSADKFLNGETVGILLLGLFAFVIGTAGGVLLGKVMNRLSGGRVNPMIGAAGVSAVPMAARVVNKIALEEDKTNFLLMQAMGPNVSGVIGSAVAAGILLQALGH